MLRSLDEPFREGLERGPALREETIVLGLSIY